MKFGVGCNTGYYRSYTVAVEGEAASRPSPASSPSPGTASTSARTPANRSSATTRARRPAFTGGTIHRAVVDVSGAPFADLAAEARMAFMRD